MGSNKRRSLTNLVYGHSPAPWPIARAAFCKGLVGRPPVSCWTTTMVVLEPVAGGQLDGHSVGGAHIFTTCEVGGGGQQS